MPPVNRIVLQRIAALALALFWAIPLRAMAATESRSVAGFDAVVLEVPGELQIEHGPDEALSLEAEPAVLRMITADVHDRRLRIALAPGRVQTNQPIRMRLAVRSLRAFESRTAAAVRIDAVQGDAASLALAGGGAVRVERLNALGLTVLIAGAGDISIAGGSARTQQVAITGMGGYAAPALDCERADVAIDGNGRARLAASRQLDVRIGGVGQVRYRGEPVVTQSIRGIGSVEKED